MRNTVDCHSSLEDAKSSIIQRANTTVQNRQNIPQTEKTFPRLKYSLQNKCRLFFVVLALLDPCVAEWLEKGYWVKLVLRSSVAG